jgi:hypothetical protein
MDRLGQLFEREKGDAVDDASSAESKKHRPQGVINNSKTRSIRTQISKLVPPALSHHNQACFFDPAPEGLPTQSIQPRP